MNRVAAFAGPILYAQGLIGGLAAVRAHPLLAYLRQIPFCSPLMLPVDSYKSTHPFFSRMAMYVTFGAMSV